MNLAGILPPVATPFTPAGDLDLDALRFNVDRWTATGLRGLVLLGTNGESAFVDDDEVDRVVDAVRERLPRDRELIVGTGCESTRATIARCRRSAACGATAALVRAPSFFKGQMDAAAFVRHYTAVADASRVPVILYNFPQALGVNLPIAAIARLAEHANVAGMKESSGDVGQIADEVSETRSRFLVVVGSAPTLHASLCVWAVGGVVALANVVPDLCVRLYELSTSGHAGEALTLQRALTPLAKLVTGVYGVPGLKAAMTLAGYRGGAPRQPLVPAGDACIDEIRRAMQALASATGATVR